MILPCDNLLLRSEASQREPLGLGPEGTLSPQVERLLAQFIEQEVGLHTKLDQLKTQLHGRFDWNLSNAFNVLDQTHEGFLNYRNLQLFLRSQSLFATDEELIAIVRRLDADADQKVTYQEFCEAFGYGMGSSQPGLAQPRGGSPQRASNRLMSPQRTSPLRENRRENSCKKSVRFQGIDRTDSLGARRSPLRPGRGYADSYNNSQEGSPLRTTSPARERALMKEYLSPSRTTQVMNRDYSSSKQPRDMGFYNSAFQNKVKNSVTRKLIAGSATKQERLLYADPNDHSFNNTRRFTDRVTSPFMPNNTTMLDLMPPIKKHLPRVSPLNMDQQDELITVVKDLINHEREMEEARVRIAIQGDFNLMDAF